MKQKILFLFLFVSLMANGQITHHHHVIRPGDQIIKRQIPYFDPGDPGEGQVWDFSYLKSEGEEYVLEYIEPYSHPDSSFIVLGRDTFPKNELGKDELLIGIEHHTAYFYRYKNNRLELIGFENPVNMMQYTRPLFVMSYPFNYGQKIEEPYTSEVVYSGEHSLVTHGSLTLEADALGTLILPSGDTIRQVVRVHSVQTIMDDARKRTTNFIAYGMQMETWRWYAKGYRYPLFETSRAVNTLSKTKEAIFTTAFYYPPQFHAYLENDFANQIIHENTKKETADELKKPATGHAIEKDNWYCDFYPNPVNTELFIEYTVKTTAQVTLALYTLDGRMLQIIPSQQKQPGMHTEKFDCSRLSTGSYVLRLGVDNEIESRVIIKN